MISSLRGHRTQLFAEILYLKLTIKTAEFSAQKAPNLFQLRHPDQSVCISFQFLHAPYYQTAADSAHQEHYLQQIPLPCVHQAEQFRL